jgi:predicted dehydrogenase
MNTQSSRKIGVGIVGVGNWGRYGHIPVLRLLPNYEIVAVASRRKEYGKQLAKEFGIPHVFTEPTDLIGYPKVDLVVILLRRHSTPVVVNQFPTITITDNGETLPNTTPDQVLVIGTLANGGVFTFQIEGGKRNNSGVQIDITGIKGDLKISNPLSFANPDDNKIEGSQGNNEPLNILPIPDSYQGLPGSKLDASVLDLAHLYAAFAKGGDNRAYDAPTFTDAVRLHRLINLISNAASAGDRQTVTQPGEFDVLATLRRSGDPYMLSPTRLYEAAMISSGGMTNRLDRLERAGLIERRPDPSDRRGKRRMPRIDSHRKIRAAACLVGIDGRVQTMLKMRAHRRNQMPAGRKPHCYLVKVRPGLLNLQTEDTFQTLATRDSFGPTVARLMSTHLLAG